MEFGKSTSIALFTLRISIFSMMILWAILKIISPAAYGGGDDRGIFQRFYGADIGFSMVYIIGTIQILFLITYVLGLFKFITTGGVMVMNLITLIVSLEQILNPFGGGPNLLFVASIPVFGASLAHFLMHKQDTLLSLGK